MKQLTIRQASMVLAFSMASVKFLVFPALTFRYAGINSYISTAISFLIDIVLISLLVFILYKFPDKSFNDLITETFGVFVTKLCYFAIFVYMLMETFLIMKEAHTYFEDTLFEDFTLTMFIVPVVILSTFIASKNLKTIGRTVEIVFPIIVFSVILMMLIPIKKIDVFGLLPILEDGFSPIIRSIGKTSFSYGDQLILLLMMGKIKMNKHKPYKIIIYACVTAFVVVAMNMMFICLFGYAGISQQLAVSEMPLHSTAPATMSRLDWLIIMIWLIMLLLQSGVFMFFAVDAFSNLTNLNKGWSVSIVSVIVAVGLILLSLKLAQLIQLVTHPAFSYVAIAIQTALPLLTVIAGIVQLGRKHETVKKTS